MRIIALSKLKEFWENPDHQDCAEPGLAWYRLTLGANWRQPADVKAEVPKVSILQDGRAVFNIGGNKYRVVVWINYAYQVVYVRFIGTHAQYDQINVSTI